MATTLAADPGADWDVARISQWLEQGDDEVTFSADDAAEIALALVGWTGLRILNTSHERLSQHSQALTQERVDKIKIITLLTAPLSIRFHCLHEAAVSRLINMPTRPLRSMAELFVERWTHTATAIYRASCSVQAGPFSEVERVAVVARIVNLVQPDSLGHFNQTVNRAGMAENAVRLFRDFFTIPTARNLLPSVQLTQYDDHGVAVPVMKTVQQMRNFLNHGDYAIRHNAGFASAMFNYRAQQRDYSLSCLFGTLHTQWANSLLDEFIKILLRKITKWPARR